MAPSRLLLRPSLASIFQTPLRQSQARFVSFKPNPRAPARNPHANVKDKIPAHMRVVERPPVPPPTISAEALQSAPWVVRRTAYAQLPVYRKWMAGATKEVIMIKKISGDRALLAEQIKEKVGVPEEKIKINPGSGHIEVTVS